jgi:hypothetical protein
VKHFHSKTLVCLTSLLAAFGVPNAAEAVTFETTVTPTSGSWGNFDSPEFGDGTIEEIRFTWSTTSNSGTVNDLEDWTVDFLDTSSNNGVVFSDTVISGGVFQDIGGISRDSSNTAFDFNRSNAGNNIVTNWNSGVTAANGGSFTGLTTGIGGFGEPSVREYDNGSSEGSSSLPNFTQTTNQQAIPFHIDILPGVGVLGGLIVFRQYRKRRKFARSASS